MATNPYVNKVVYGADTIIDISGTTATADKILQGYGAYGADGAWMDGTASGGGGGASNVVTGEFTTQSSNGAQIITLPYTGSGYPIMAIITVSGGAYNDTNTDWYDLVSQYATAMWTMTKSNMTTAPTYTTSGKLNYGVVAAVYKNSTSSATTYSRTSSMNQNAYSSGNATNSSLACAKFKSSTSLSVYVNSSSYGFRPDMKFTYCIVYSS